MASNNIKLSILIPSVPNRLERCFNLNFDYGILAAAFGLSDSVEVLIFTDNKKRSIGQKRNDLINLAQGDYVVMTDDDDTLTAPYFRRIAEAMESGADVITYKQEASINGVPSVIVFRHNNVNEEYKGWGITQRPAWHCCTWKKSVLESCKFDLTNWGEDNAFAIAANAAAKTEYFIDEICHVYTHDENKTEAHP